MPGNVRAGRLVSAVLLGILTTATMGHVNKIQQEWENVFETSVLAPIREVVLKERHDHQNETSVVIPSTATGDGSGFKFPLIIMGALLLIGLPLAIILFVYFCRDRVRERFKSKPATLPEINDVELKSQSYKSRDSQSTDLPYYLAPNSVSPMRSMSESPPPEPYPRPQFAKKQPIEERLNEIYYDKKFEIQLDNLKLGRIIGDGHFGKVCMGWVLRPKGPSDGPHSHISDMLPVAVKAPKHNGNHDEMGILYEELKIMSNIPKHPNILTLVGAVTNFDLGEIYVILERCEGSLIDKLKEGKARFRDELVFSMDNQVGDGGYLGVAAVKKCSYASEEGQEIQEIASRLSTSDLLSFGYQIALGMEFLTSIPCLHRDLAARNVLVTKDNLIRIADFGLARKSNKEYYRIQNSFDVPLPVRWMSPEAMQNLYFSEASDVWSYGILLYELFTLGGLPYPGMPDDKVPERVTNGERNPRPVYCHEELYHLMLESWKETPEERPKFTNCVEVLEDHLTRASPKMLSSLNSLLARERMVIDSYAEWR